MAYQKLSPQIKVDFKLHIPYPAVFKARVWTCNENYFPGWIISFGKLTNDITKKFC